MMDLIERQVAIDKFESWLKVKGYSEGELNMLRAVLCELRYFPSAQLERKKGKWIDQKGGGCCCSECGRYALDEVDGNFIHVAAKSNYCPNCGADMTEGD